MTPEQKLAALNRWQQAMEQADAAINPVIELLQPGHVGDLVQTPIPGVWRDSFDFGGHQRWTCCPLYYRAVSGPAGQGDLFA